MQFPDLSTIEGVFGSYGMLYTLLIWLGGYLTPFIPIINKIPAKFYQVMAIELVIIVSFALFGFKVDTISAIINFAMANLLHNGISKPIINYYKNLSVDI